MKQYALSLLLVFTIKTIAQDGCSNVLRLASRNVSIENSKASVAKYVYETFCEGKSKKNNVNFGADVTDLMSNVGFNFGSKSENIKHICENYESLYKSKVESFTLTNTVVDDALRYWYQCKRLSSQGVTFDATVNPTQFSISMRSKDDIATTLKSISFDPRLLDCKCKMDGRQVIFNSTEDEYEFAELQNSLICTRKSASVNGTTIYPMVDLIISTNKGDFSLVIPREGKPNYNWLSDIDIKLAEVDKNLNSIKSTLIDIERHEILGVAEIINGKLIKGTAGLTYDGNTGEITFKNVNQLSYVPVVSDLEYEKNYISNTHFIKTIISPTKLKVRATAMDTGSRNNEPYGFLIHIIGFKN